MNDIYFESKEIELPIETNVTDVYWWGSTTWDLDDVILMQYTGLKDKNGREIYEGDVYAHNVQDYVAGHPRETNFIKPVTFEMGAFWVGDMLLIDAIENDSESKVIGNIYENPELLEGAN